MSGLLRRIKRSRSADAGEAHAEGQAAGPEDAPTTAETAELPAGATAPAIKADPHTPAGLDPAEPVAPPAGRRGRLRRRLRYLRRARELMLRDLGGLLYEVHRSGGGDIAAHAGVIGGKVERLSRLDAEAAAIETALGARRSEAVVFEPGIGGTCSVCGELYGSAARFCSHCGTPTGTTAATPTGTTAATRTGAAPAMPTGATAATPTAAPATPPAEPRPVPPMPKAPAASGEGPAGEHSASGEPRPGELRETATAGDGRDLPPSGDASAKTPAGDATRTLDATRGPRGPEPAADETRELDAATDEPKPAREADAEHKPLSSSPNGRAEEHSPGLSSSDPLAARERS